MKQDNKQGIGKRHKKKVLKKDKKQGSYWQHWTRDSCSSWRRNLQDDSNEHTKRFRVAAHQASLLVPVFQFLPLPPSTTTHSPEPYKDS